MKLLLDTCVWGGALKELQNNGHDVFWAGEWPTDPGDDEILDHAYHENRILVTLDKDFGELAIVRGVPHAGIIRLVNLRARQQADACLRVIGLHGDDLMAGAIITVEPNRMRIRLSTGREE
ncbi:MAG: toxin-antitoxin system, toxin component, PIN family protein [Deltaproteobacteria bacterium RBG_16_49_23]|nr:MAG: toxin-antitoxin system, toxin component, PIN family protein [Deltaproteobacteria bacterium RBG_16_49_23]